MSSSRQSNLFASATLRLTGWYVLIIMVISLLFSFVLYAVTSVEVERALAPRRPGQVRIFLESGSTQQAREQIIMEGNARIITSLVLFNIVVLVSGTLFSYLLARRTLRPIEAAHIAQARFASDAAHELRTPLAVMKTEAEVVLRNTQATKQQYKTALASTLEEVERMRTLTERLLALAAQQQLVIETVSVEEVAIDIVTRLLPLARDKQIVIDNTIGAHLVAANHEALANILEIFIENAIKYSPKQTTITLLATPTGHGKLRLAVRDQGPGLAPTEQTQVFERFYRVDTSRSKEYVEGYGLGLSLARRLGEEMQAVVGVVSEAGNGAEFYVEVPLVRS